MPRFVELDAINEHDFSVTIGKAVIDLDYVYIAMTPSTTKGTGLGKHETTMLRFKGGDSYVLVRVPYETMREMLIGFQVNEAIMKE